MRTFLCPVLLSRHVDSARIWVTPVVNPNENRPLESARANASSCVIFLLKRELTDEAMGKECAFRVICFSHDSDTLVANELSKILALASELGTHLTDVVNPSQEHKRCPRLGVIPCPD